MARQHPEEPTLVELTIEEVKAMGKQGMDHPSTRPVLTGGAVGAVHENRRWRLARHDHVLVAPDGQHPCIALFGHAHRPFWMAAQVGRPIEADGVIIKAVDHDGGKDAWIGPDRQPCSR